MFGRLVPDRTKRLVGEEREWLSKLQRSLARFEADAADQSALERSIAQLDRLFLLVVIGEFNAGKSAFVNALVGSRVLEEGPTPTTTRLQILRYGDTPGRHIEQQSIDVISAPVPLLCDLDIVDTPGTNAIFREHERLTSEFVPQADLVLFVTSSDRPFTESERAFLEHIRNWGKKIVVIINKIDVLDRPDDREQVKRFVTEHAQALFGSKPEVFAISAREAQRAKDRGAAASAPPSNVAGDQFAELERYIGSTLDQQERLRLKLLNPVGIGLRLADSTRTTIRSRLDLLRQDLQTIDDIDRQLGVYRTDLSREFEFRLSEVDNILHQFENRGIAFFDDTLRIGRIPDLLNKARLQREFERTVVADVPQQIEKQVHDVIDWMVSSELRQWQAVNEHVNRRRAAHKDRVVGGTDAQGFQYDRARLINTVGRAAQQAVQTYDKEQEASAMADGVRAAVAGAALAQAGAISLGTLVTLLATTTAADVTGIIAAGTVAVLGLFVIPSKRAKAKADLRERIAEMRDKLMTDLRGQFEREVDRSVHGVLDAVAPYTRFVRAEHEKLTGLDKELAEIDAALARIRTEIDRAAA
ncbi:MAG TPA: dynamin family protein [Vicinamibacterales bacterium]|nr:dynamin family protein [Vicinamibacterales bacterium]